MLICSPVSGSGIRQSAVELVLAVEHTSKRAGRPLELRMGRRIVHHVTLEVDAAGSGPEPAEILLSCACGHAIGSFHSFDQLPDSTRDAVGRESSVNPAARYWRADLFIG